MLHITRWSMAWAMPMNVSASLIDSRRNGITIGLPQRIVSPARPSRLVHREIAEESFPSSTFMVCMER